RGHLCRALLPHGRGLPPAGRGLHLLQQRDRLHEPAPPAAGFGALPVGGPLGRPGPRSAAGLPLLVGRGDGRREGSEMRATGSDRDFERLERRVAALSPARRALLADRLAAAPEGADPTEDRRLVAYVVTRSGRPARPGDLRAFLRVRLPEPMVPGAF